MTAAGCAPLDKHARAAHFDERYGTSAFTWLVDHEPSRLDVSGVPLALVASFVPDARIRAAGQNVRTACRTAKADRALLLAFVLRSDAAARALALDCGFALARDSRALILAPR